MDSIPRDSFEVIRHSNGVWSIGILGGSFIRRDSTPHVDIVSKCICIYVLFDEIIEILIMIVIMTN